MDRVPLKDVVDRPTEAPEMDNRIAEAPVGPNVEDLRAMREMSLMFGFDGDGFEGDAGKALEVYNWAIKEAPSMEDALLMIKDAIKITGSQSVKKALLNKVHLWASLEDSILSLRKRQVAIE